MVLVVSAGLLVSTGLVVWLYFSGPNNNQNLQTKQEKINSSNKLFFSAMDEAGNVSYDSGQSVMDEALNSASSDEDRAHIYTQKSSLAINVGKYDDAYNFAKKAEEISPNLSSAQLMALSSESKGDIQEAIKNYHNALNRMTGNSGADDFDKQDIVNKIKSLGGSI
jgi:tetratricopeptide (TPR) repeat protein